MTTTISEASKKRAIRKLKRYEFHKFANPGSPINLSRPFRDNIRVFLQECGEIEQYNIEGMPIWCTMLVNNGVDLPLFTVEESVKYSSRPICYQCRCAGWSHHFVSKRRYHFIIPNDEEWNRPLEGRDFDLQTHLLHGLIHCNGFGHLLCIHGLEGGSKFLCGKEIMDLWDRICTLLRTRKITVVDMSKKRSMDLRLLHGVAYGHPWFGNWGYKFHRGSFGITKKHYDKAIEVLSSLNLDNNIIYDCIVDTTEKERLKTIIRYYRDTDKTKLITLRDLLHSMLTLKAPAPLMQRKCILNTEGAITTSSKPPLTKSNSPTDDVYLDILFLYQTVLKGYPPETGLASRVVIDCKHFVKDWLCNDKEDDALLRFECRVIPDSTELESFLTRPQPGELLVLEPYATVGELKMAVEMALIDTYYLMEKFVIVAMDVDGLEGEAEDGDVLIGTVESGAQVWVTVRGRRGRESGMDSGTEQQLLVYEGGADDWTVDCCCKADDDDGERMVSCDECDVWQHTRCSGIEDSETPPEKFVCEGCRESHMPQLDEQV